MRTVDGFDQTPQAFPGGEVSSRRNLIRLLPNPEKGASFGTDGRLGSRQRPAGIQKKGELRIRGEMFRKLGGLRTSGFCSGSPAYRASGRPAGAESNWLDCRSGDANVSSPTHRSEGSRNRSTNFADDGAEGCENPGSLGGGRSAICFPMGGLPFVPPSIASRGQCNIYAKN